MRVFFRSGNIFLGIANKPMEDAEEGCLIESADGRSDPEVLKRYAKIGEVVCDIANHGDDAEVRRKGDGSYAIYAVKKNKVTV